VSDRPRGGRRREDFPDVRARDARVLAELTRRGRATRNEIALAVGRANAPRLVTYSLERLRAEGDVEQVRQGNGGRGYWKIIGKGATDGQD
jgi:hypothetical protein